LWYIGIIAVAVDVVIVDKFYVCHSEKEVNSEKQINLK